SASQLLGTGQIETLYTPGTEVEPGCWARFTPGPRIVPNGDVAPTATTTIRFSKPIDPASVQPFDALQTVRGAAASQVDALSLVVGTMHQSLDLRDVTFVPSLPYAHAGDRPVYHMNVLTTGGITDLAGNELGDAPLPIEFSIDP